MGYTGWLMPDGKFYPCKHKEHTETLQNLFEMPQYHKLMADNVSRGKPFRSEPEGCMCFWDMKFRFLKNKTEEQEEAIKMMKEIMEK